MIKGLLVNIVNKVFKRMYSEGDRFVTHTDYERQVVKMLSDMELVKIDKAPIKTRLRKRQFKYKLTPDGIKLIEMVLKAEGIR